MSDDLTRSGIPYNRDAEKGVLCSAMLQPECMEELGDLTAAMGIALALLFFFTPKT